MNATRRSLEQWRDYVGGCLDFRPEEGIFRIARDMFTEPELFDLEMELIFEKNWIYACHESELARPHDFVTLRAGRQPLIVTRDGNGQLHALVNACQHRGATLVRVGKGNQSTFTCPFHAWCYKNDGRLVKVKAPGEYPEGFDKATRGLKKARIQSYRGFVFVSLDVAGEDDLVDFLGDARVFLDMLVAQSPSGELEVLPGTSTYTYEGNWKLQNENGLDGYHVSTVHYNYVATVQHRQQVEAERGGVAATLDYSKLGAGDAATDDGWFSFANGHSVLFSEMPNPAVRPGYASVMPRLVAEYGQARGLAGADTEHPVFQAGTAGVVDQRHLALRIAGVALLGLPLRQVELALFVELREVAVPVLGIAEFGVAVEELFDAVLQSGVHGVTSFARRARRSRPSRRKRRQCACWLT